MQDKQQDKQKEIAFFDAHGAADAYDVFTPETNARFVDAFVKLSGLPPGARVADLGCGSGAFTAQLVRAGYDSVGLDLSAKLVEIGRRITAFKAEMLADMEARLMASENLKRLAPGAAKSHRQSAG